MGGSDCARSSGVLVEQVPGVLAWRASATIAGIASAGFGALCFFQHSNSVSKFRIILTNFILNVPRLLSRTAYSENDSWEFCSKFLPQRLKQGESRNRYELFLRDNVF